jgi:ABC-type antimicrobial peptide transport system permease subunit
MVLHVRNADMQQQSVTAAIKKIVQRLDANLPVINIRTMNKQVEASLYTVRMLSVLLSSFGALVLLLASIGIYGVMASAVGRRKRELSPVPYESA